MKRLRQDIDEHTKTIHEATRAQKKQAATSIREELEAMEESTSIIEKQKEHLSHQSTFMVELVTREKTLSELYNSSSDTCLVCGSHMDKNAHSDTNPHSHRITHADMLSRALQEKHTRVSRYEGFIRETMNKRMRNQDNTDWGRVITTATHDREKAEQLLETYADRLDALDTTIDEKIDALEKLQSELDNLAEETRDDDVANVDDRIDELNDSIDTYQRDVERYNDFVQEKKNREDTVNSCARDVREQEAIVHAFVTLREQTSVKGGISEDIDRICEEITDSANITYKSVYGRDGDIKLSTVIVKDTPTSVITAYGRPIETFSHGEQNRMIMCILMGVTGALYTRYSVWLPPLWDEPTSVIDSDGIGTACDILHNVPDNEQSFIIVREFDGTCTQSAPDNIIEL